MAVTVSSEHANGNEGNTESLENSPPLANAVLQNNVFGYAAVGGGTLGPQFPLTVNAIPTKAIWPYMQQWHLDIQRELVSNTVATVSYVGSKGRTSTGRLTSIRFIPCLLLTTPISRVSRSTGLTQRRVILTMIVRPK